jgi:hypothetical protein
VEDALCLLVHGLHRGAPFRIVARVDGFYYELAVDSMEELQDMSLIHARFPVCVTSGFAWVEVLQDTSAACSISPPVPCLVTPVPDVMEELRRFNAQGSRKPAPQRAAAMLRDMDEVLHVDPDCQPREVSFLRAAVLAASLGWHATLAEMFDNASDRGLLATFLRACAARTNLLGCATLSRNEAAVAVVLDAFEESGVDAGVLQPTGQHGMTPLHCAAIQGSEDTCSLLMASCPQARFAWDNLRVGVTGHTPSQFLHACSEGRQSTDTSADRIGALEAEAVKRGRRNGEPSCDANREPTSLRCPPPLRSTNRDRALAVCWAIACVMLASHLPLTCLFPAAKVALLLSFALHVGVPLCRGYRAACLSEARAVAAAHGAELSSRFVFLDPTLNLRYHEHAIGTTQAAALHSFLVISVGVSSWAYFQLQGSTGLVTYAALCAAPLLLAAAKTCFIIKRAYESSQWVNLALCAYVQVLVMFLVWCSPRETMAAAGVPLALAVCKTLARAVVASVAHSLALPFPLTFPITGLIAVMALGALNLATFIKSSGIHLGEGTLSMRTMIVVAVVLSACGSAASLMLRAYYEYRQVERFFSASPGKAGKCL